MGPKIDVTPPKPNISRTLKRYKDPENSNIPIVKAIKETRMDWLLAREKVEMKSKAKVW